MSQASRLSLRNDPPSVLSIRNRGLARVSTAAGSSSCSGALSTHTRPSFCFQSSSGVPSGESFNPGPTALPSKPHTHRETNRAASLSRAILRRPSEPSRAALRILQDHPLSRYLLVQAELPAHEGCPVSRFHQSEDHRMVSPFCVFRQLPDD